MPSQSIKQRKDGRYAVRFGSKYFYGNTQKEALSKREEYKSMLAKGLKEQANSMSFAQYASRWLPATKANVADNTYNDYARHLNKFAALVGDIKLKDISSLHIKEFYNSIAHQSKSSIDHHSNTIKALFSSAQNDGLILHNPCFKVAKPKGTKGTHRNLEKWEVDLIVSMREHALYPFVMAMLFAGLRRGEALALNIENDVDFSANTLSVTRAVAYKGNAAFFKSPKTEAGERTIPLFDILKQCLLNRKGLLFFQKSKGNQTPASLQAFERKFESFVYACETKLNDCPKRWYGRTKAHKQILAEGKELPPWRDFSFRPHDCRHTYCTMLYNAGVDLKTAQKWLGHADTKMILEIYSHLTEDREQKAALNVSKQLAKQFEF